MNNNQWQTPSQIPRNRMSMLKPPNTASQSFGGGLAGLEFGMNQMSISKNRISDNPRESMLRAQRSLPNLSSGVSRRSSTYSTRPSITGRDGVPTKDPRNIRDKQWQADSIKNLINFLVQSGYNHAISAKSLQAPSSKDFQLIFKFIYAQIDPNYEYQKKFEEEVPVILKGLRYPFENQISKSNLHAVGTMHAWPALLAMLVWMMELVMCCNDDDDGFDEFEDEAQDEQRAEIKLFFDYLGKAYRLFMEGDDNLDVVDQEYIQKFERRNEIAMMEVQKIAKSNETLERELKDLSSSEPPIQREEREHGVLLSDKEKFINFIDHIKKKKQKLLDSILQCKEDLKSQEEELKALTEERSQLQQKVDSQEISPADVDRMNATREQLSKSIQDLMAKSQEASKIVWEQEMALQKNIDSLEKQIQTFNSLAYQLRLLPEDTTLMLSSRAPSFAMKVLGEATPIISELQFNVQGQREENMLSLDLKNAVKPMLNKLKQQCKQAQFNAQEECIALQEMLDKLGESHSEKLDEVQILQNRLKSAEKQYQEIKETVGKRTNVANVELDGLEREIQKIKLENGMMLTMANERLQKIALEFQDLDQSTKIQKENIGGAVTESLSTVIEFKAAIEDELFQLKQIIEEDYKEAAKLEADGERYAEYTGTVELSSIPEVAIAAEDYL